MIKTKKDLKEYLNVELKKYKTSFILRMFNIGEGSILYKHQKLLRKTEYYTNTSKKILSLFYRVRLMKIQNKYCLHIPINSCDIGLKIMHVGPILINKNSKIGKNCSIHINTGIVAGGRDNNCPTIGDNVVIGIGAVILGGVTVADGVAIGANAVVNKNVLESNIAVAGVPAKKISDNGRSSWNKNQ